MKQFVVRAVLGVGLASGALLPGCSGTEAPRSVGSSAGAGGANVNAGVAGATGGRTASDGGGGNVVGASCMGAAPSCRGQDIGKCCQNDPYGPASCNNGAWVCTLFSVQYPAPGCNGQSCYEIDQDGANDAGAGGQASDAGSGGLSD